MSTIWVFDNIKNKYNLYCGEDCMKKFCITLREHAAMKLITVVDRKRANITSKFNHVTFEIRRKKITRKLAKDNREKIEIEKPPNNRDDCHLPVNTEVQ